MNTDDLEEYAQKVVDGTVVTSGKVRDYCAAHELSYDCEKCHRTICNFYVAIDNLICSIETKEGKE